jgi:hypothetical protein
MLDITFKTGIAIITVLVGMAAALPARWRVSAKRAWSYGVYYVGYRMLSVQLKCGDLAVSGVPFILKNA